MKKLTPEQIERILDENFGFANVKEAMLFMQDEVLRLNGFDEDGIHEAEKVCMEAYQVVGSLLSDVGKFDSDEAEKILDNLIAGKLVHKDVLPWLSYEKPRAIEADAGKMVVPGISAAEYARQCREIPERAAAMDSAREQLGLPPRATGCPDTMDDTARFAADELPAILKKQAG